MLTMKILKVKFHFFLLQGGPVNSMQGQIITASSAQAWGHPQKVTVPTPLST